MVTINDGIFRLTLKNPLIAPRSTGCHTAENRQRHTIGRQITDNNGGNAQHGTLRKVKAPHCHNQEHTGCGNHQHISLAEQQLNVPGLGQLSACQNGKQDNNRCQTGNRQYVAHNRIIHNALVLFGRRQHCRFSLFCHFKYTSYLNHLSDEVFFSERWISFKFTAEFAIFHNKNAVAHTEQFQNFF
jgi:hypothetical protein